MQIQPEGIITNIFQNSEWTISNCFQLFTFSVECLFSNLKPKFITKLENLIHMMFIMSCLVFDLTLFQLFLKFLM